jgi:hypothetical protein
MSTRRMFMLATLLMLFCLAPPQVSAQESTPAKSKLNHIVFNGDMATLLAQLASMHKVNIGLEADPRQPRTNVKIEFRFNTVDEVIKGGHQGGSRIPLATSRRLHRCLSSRRKLSAIGNLS